MNYAPSYYINISLFYHSKRHCFWSMQLAAEMQLFCHFLSHKQLKVPPLSLVTLSNRF